MLQTLKSERGLQAASGASGQTRAPLALGERRRESIRSGCSQNGTRRSRENAPRGRISHRRCGVKEARREGNRAAWFHWRTFRSGRVSSAASERKHWCPRAGAGLGFRGAARLPPSTRVAVAPTRSLCGDALGSPHSHLGQTQVRAFT